MHEGVSYEMCVQFLDFLLRPVLAQNKNRPRPRESFPDGPTELPLFR
jgi:hypothetical protein